MKVKTFVSTCGYAEDTDTEKSMNDFMLTVSVKHVTQSSSTHVLENGRAAVIIVHSIWYEENK